MAEYKLAKEEEVELEQKRDKPEDSVEIEVATKIIKNEEGKGELITTCKYKKIKDAALKPLEDVLLNRQWREYLCKCSECMEIYNKKKLDFLFIAEETPIHELLEYQDEDSKEETKEMRTFPDNGIYDRLCQSQLGALPADRQHVFINGYRKLVGSFSEYFKEHLEKGKVITKDDIEEFFEAFNKSK
jgi:E3 ubiquitin-protein ligase UBR7